MRMLLTSTALGLALTAGAMSAAAQAVIIYEQDAPWVYTESDSSAARQSNGVETANGAPVFEEAERNGGGN